MRTKYCGKLRLSNVNQKIILCGWVECTRNFGNFIFINLRDCTGVVQIFFNKKNSEMFHHVLKIKNESCIQIIGIVQERSKKNKNQKLKTGDIEVIGEKIKIFNFSPPLPINISNIDDDIIRLKYRYLDLRRLKMLKNLKVRSKIIDIIRIFMNNNNFLNIETPILTKSTPEGAKDYLVSSRIHKGKYYALPQSPQLFKQLLMISGIDRYYQIVKCFRDEDLRSDRQPEFTQIDLEASFVNQNTIRKITESMIKILWEKIINYKLKSFPILSFHDAIKKYGSDKPDLRNPLELFDISNRIMDNIIYEKNKKNTRTAGLIVPNGLLLLNKNKINILNDIIRKYDKIFHMYIYIKNIQLNQYDIFSSNQKINHQSIIEICHKYSIKNKDIIYIFSGESNIVNKLFNNLRNIIGKMINVITKNMWKPVWIIDFPMFKKDHNNNLSSVHHPFTAPKNATIHDIIANPESIISNSYDLVMNGYEIGGGSVRIHNYDMQKAILKILNIFDNKKKNTLDFFLNALQYGTPPHAGIALGLDRITMLLTNSDSIKEVIAFPKTNSATCLMTNAPSKTIY